LLAQLFARYGVPFYWLVDPKEPALQAYVLGAGGYSDLRKPL